MSYLKKKNLWEAISKSETTPPEEDSNGALCKWRIKVDKPLSKIDVRAIRDDKIRKEVWDMLVTMLQLLHNKLLSITQHNTTIAQYFYRVKSLLNVKI